MKKLKNFGNAKKPSLAWLGAGRDIAFKASAVKPNGKRSILNLKASAYEYQSVKEWQGEQVPIPRLKLYPELSQKRQRLYLSDIRCFHTESSMQPHLLPDRLIEKLDPELLLPLLDAVSPTIGMTKRGQFFAATNPILLSIAQYLVPFHRIKVRLLVKSPTRPLTLAEAASAAQLHYKPLVETNKQLLARIAKTNREAELLSGYSASYCYDLRKNHGSH